MNLNGKKIHFMGAGGIGVSALAVMAKAAGAEVSACDKGENAITKMLETEGIPVLLGHSAEHGIGKDVLVYTSAVPAGHPELTAAAVTEKRGAFLAALMRGREAWGVSGTHGKTTTSWMLASILIEAGLDPSVFVGGVVPGLGDRNFRLGHGLFVAELDESDASFLLPELSLAVITNIESDHMTHYASEAALYGAFTDFAAGVAESGVLIAGVDNPAAQKILAGHPGKKISFGINVKADFTAGKIRSTETGAVFECFRRGASLGEFRLNMSGAHNVQNALAALAATVGMGIDPDAARRALASIHGVRRRMENLGFCGAAVLYSDYAHHPTEVSAAITSLREMHGGRTLVVFQPHLYSRTRDYAEDFRKALSLADKLLLVDIYPAREEPLEGIDSRLLVPAGGMGAVEAYGPVALEDVCGETVRLAEGCEAVVMMGAGSIDDAARSLAAAKKNGERRR